MPQDDATSARRKRWLINGKAPLLWKSWDDDDYVVYSTASGDTHQINEVTAEVLRQLERSELDFPDLTRKLADALGTDLDPQTETYVARLLEYLDEIGLVESIP